MTGTSAVNLYGLSGQVTSGTDVIIGAATSGRLSLGNVYDGGNFTYSLLSTATSEDVIVAAAAIPLATAYWKGGQNNVWSILVGGTASNWTTDSAGTNDPKLTPSATTDVIFSANSPANESNTVLGASMTIKSLTISDSNAVTVSGSDANSWMGTDTLTISGTNGVNINIGAGTVTLGANLYMSGSSQKVTVENAAGLVVTGTMAGTVGLYVGGNSSGSAGASYLLIASGASINPAQTTIWNTATLAFGENATLTGPLGLDGGTLTLVDGQLQTVTFTSPVTISAGSNLDFEVGNGSDQIAISGSGSLAVNGNSTVNLYGLSGQVTSGTDVIIGAATSGRLSLGNVYNSGNFVYSLLSTATSEDVIATAAANPLTTAYWKGGRDNVWSILLGGTATNWTTDYAGTNDPQLTPSATTDLIFSANSPANESNTVLGTNMSIKSLMVSDTNAVTISGLDPNPWMGNDTLTVSGSTGTTGVTVSGGAGLVTIAANLYLAGGSQTLTVNNAPGMIVSGTIGSGNGLVKSGTGTLTLTGDGLFGGATVDTEGGTLAIENGGEVSGSYGDIGANAGAGATVIVSGSGSTWSTPGSLYVGGGENAALQIAGGGTVLVGQCFIGAPAGSNAMVTVSGSGSTLGNINGANAYVYVGANGSGTLQITNGGAILGVNGYVGFGDGSSGTAFVSGSGSVWTSDSYFHVGFQGGTGTVQVTDGGVLTDYNGLVQGVSSVTVSGSGSAWINDNEIIISTSGTGMLQIINGGSVSDMMGYVYSLGGSIGTVLVSGSGSTWTNSSALYISGLGTIGTAAFLRIADGGSVLSAQTDLASAGTLAFGENATLNSPLAMASGSILTLVDGHVQTVSLTNPVSISTGAILDFEVGNGSDQIAFSGIGSATLSGTSVVNLYGLSGQVTSGTDVIVGAATSGHLSLGNVYNTGNFTYSLLSTATSEDVTVNPAASPLTTAYWKGGQDNIWSILVGGTATNWTTDSSGTTDPQLTPGTTTDVIFSVNSPANESDTLLGTNMTIKSLTISDTNSVTVAGADSNPWMGIDTLTISGSAGATGIAVNTGAGLVTIAANLYLSGSSQTLTVNNAAGMLVSGTIGSSSGLIKSGTGTLTLAGSGTYGGPTLVNAGTLVVSGTLNATSLTTVNNATLAGAGSIANGVTIGSGTGASPSAKIVPGAIGSIGVLTIGGALTLDSDALFVFNLDSTNGGAGNGSSELFAASVSLNPDSEFSLSDISSDPGLLTLGAEFDVIETTGGITGTFENLPNDSLFTSGSNTYLATYSPNGLTVTVVPEPGTWSMTLAALGVLCMAFKRKVKPARPFSPRH